MEDNNLKGFNLFRCEEKDSQRRKIKINTPINEINDPIDEIMFHIEKASG